MQFSTLVAPLVLLGAVYAQGTSTVGKDGLTTSWTTITTTQTTTITSTVLSNATAAINSTIASSTPTPARYSPTLPVSSTGPTAAAVSGLAASNFPAGAAAAAGLVGAVAAFFL